MFTAAGTLSPLPGAKLERLRLSLNTPVVALENLAVGPAAAGIAIHSGQEALRLTVAVRSARSGQAVFFHPEGWGESELSDVAFDAALSFAEGMGFLFDEDLLEKGLDATQAARAWADFLEDSLPEEEAFDPQEAALSAGVDERAADATAPPAFETAVPVPQGSLAVPETSAALSTSAVPASETLAAPLLLSKFRFLSSIPAGRLLSAPPRPPQKPVRTNFVMRLLSRF